MHMHCMPARMTIDFSEEFMFVCRFPFEAESQPFVALVCAPHTGLKGVK